MIGAQPPWAARRERLKAETARLFAARGGKDGSPRITAALREAGWRVSENTVAALMREQGLAARARKRRKGTTRPGRGRRRAPDLVKRKFAAGGVNRRWYGDGTEVKTAEGKLYLDSVWNIDSRALDDRIPAQAVGGEALSVAFSADGTLAVGDRSGTTLLWDETAGDFSASSPSLVSLPGPADSGGVTAVTFASDGTLAAGYGNGEAYVWDTFVSSPTISDAEYGSGMTSAAWADDAGTLAVAHADGQVSLSQWTDGEPGISGPGQSPVGYAVPSGEAATAADWTTTGGDSMFAAGAAGGTTYVWDHTSSTGPVKDAGPRGVSVTALSFAPGGTTMATGGSDGKVRLWRVTANL